MIRFVDGTIDPLLWFLVDWSIRLGVLIIGLAVWFRARPPRRAATRHLCCATALAVGLFLPLAPRWAAPWEWPWPHVAPAPPRAQPVNRAPISGPVQSAVPVTISESVRPAVPPTIAAPVERDAHRIQLPVTTEMPAAVHAAAPEGLGAWRLTCLGLAVVWLAGAGVSLAQIVVGRGVLGRLRSSSRPVAQVALVRFRCELDARRLATLAAHPAVGSPVVLGGLAPCILVPDDWDDLPEASQRACLLHELAHLDRRDDLAKLAAEIATNPLLVPPGGQMAARAARPRGRARLRRRGGRPRCAPSGARPTARRLRRQAVQARRSTRGHQPAGAGILRPKYRRGPHHSTSGGRYEQNHHPRVEAKDLGPEAGIVAAVVLWRSAGHTSAPVEPEPQPPEPTQGAGRQAGPGHAPARSFSDRRQR